MKKHASLSRLLSLVTALALLTSLSVVSAYAAEDTAPQTAGFVNTSGDGGEDFIALCDQWISQMEIELNQEALDTYTPDRLNLEALLGNSSSSEETAGSLSLSSA